MSARAYIAIIAVLFGALVVVESMRPAPLDLRIRLERDGSAPFDAEVFFASLPAWLGQPVEPVGMPPFVQLADSAQDATYLFLAETFAPDPAEAGRLLAFVARGNTVFVAAHQFGGAFADSLGRPDPFWDTSGLTTNAPFPFGSSTVGGSLGADTLRLVPPGIAGTYAFPVGLQLRHLVGLDPTRTEILGTDPLDDEPTLARIRWRQGEVIVSSTPLAFSNAALTGDGDGAAYVGAVLAALPDRPVWWDDRYKPVAELAQTPLRYILTTPALRWAYAMLLLAGVLFVLFRGRRWQRPVPVVAPPPNAQREFARTVGRLHYTHRDDAQLGRRLAETVRARLRDELRIADPAWDDATARLAAARAGVPEDEARDLFRALAGVSGQSDLVRLDARIARFFRHTGTSPRS
ncbi:MAG: DUF4350 domain-containing protein [Bacteroidota bacterium]